MTIGPPPAASERPWSCAQRSAQRVCQHFQACKSSLRARWQSRTDSYQINPDHVLFRSRPSYLSVWQFRTMLSWLHDGLLLQLLYTFTVAFTLKSMYDVGPQLEADFLGAELPQCCTIARDLVNPRSANWASGMPFEVQESTGNLHWSFLFENHSSNAKWSDFESALGSTCNLGIQLIRSTLLRDSLSIKKT